MFSSDQETAFTEALRCQANTDDGNCPVCGDPVRECTGHTQVLDAGYWIFSDHEADDHSRCAYSI